MLLDSISELSYEDADFIIDVVDQYLAQIDGNEEDKRKIVRRYASLIVSDIRKQILSHTERKTEDIHIVQKIDPLPQIRKECQKRWSHSF